jgi:hypothetical protein
VTESSDWWSAFLAVSSLLGEPGDVARAALGEAGSPQSLALSNALGSPSREVRARAVARVVAGLVAELEQSRLA